jgi:hypothetical protein
MWLSRGRSRPEEQVPCRTGLNHLHIEEASFCRLPRCKDWFEKSLTVDANDKSYQSFIVMRSGTASYRYSHETIPCAILHFLHVFNHTAMIPVLFQRMNSAEMHEGKLSTPKCLIRRFGTLGCFRSRRMREKSWKPSRLS